jgi:hypothetical protein
LNETRRYYDSLSDFDKHFYLDVRNAGERADALFARSALMLISGIVVAFIGIAIFAFAAGRTSVDEPVSVVSAEYSRRAELQRYGNKADSPAETQPADQKEEHEFYLKKQWQQFLADRIGYFTSNMKFVLIFVFMETIAWFLLKQYRALVEDYKLFYRMYLKRQNYFTSYLVLRSQNSRENSQAVLVAALLQENLTGVLKAGEKLDSQPQLDYAEQLPMSSAGNFITRIAEVVRGQLAEQPQHHGPTSEGRSEASHSDHAKSPDHAKPIVK